MLQGTSLTVPDDSTHGRTCSRRRRSPLAPCFESSETDPLLARVRRRTGGLPAAGRADHHRTHVHAPAVGTVPHAARLGVRGHEPGFHDQRERLGRADTPEVDHDAVGRRGGRRDGRARAGGRGPPTRRTRTRGRAIRPVRPPNTPSVSFTSLPTATGSFGRIVAVYRTRVGQRGRTTADRTGPLGSHRRTGLLD